MGCTSNGVGKKSAYALLAVLFCVLVAVFAAPSDSADDTWPSTYGTDISCDLQGTVLKITYIGVGDGEPMSDNYETRPWASVASEITEVEIGEKVLTVGIGAFKDCTSLSKVTLGKDVIIINNDAFANCTNLTSINVNEGSSVFSSSDGVLYKNNNTLVLYPAGKTDTSFVVPISVTSIDEKAFAGADSLIEVTLAKLTLSVGDNCFSGCTNLTYVYLKETSLPTLGNGSLAIGSETSPATLTVFHGMSEAPAIPVTATGDYTAALTISTADTFNITYNANGGTDAPATVTKNGGETIASFFRCNLVDRYTVFVGSLIIGGRDAPTPADGVGWVRESGLEMELKSSEVLGNGVLLTYSVR